MFQTKSCIGTRNTILCPVTFSENRAVFEIMWKKCCRAGQARDDNMTRRVGFACWVPKATNTHKSCEVLIGFPPQQRLHERDSLLRYTRNVCLSVNKTRNVRII